MNSQEKIEQAVANLENMGVVKYPDPRLKEVATEIEHIDDNLKALADKMIEMMFENKGIGLAAPQVGVTVRMFICTPTFDPDDVHVYINPKVISGDKPQTDEEGCLSFPNIYCKVKRPSRIKIEATNLDGEKISETFTDLAARVFQHELDHLDGILLADKMSSIAKMVNRASLANLREQFEKDKN